jgi:hypothetical protein
MNDKIKRAAQSEAETWHEVCQSFFRGDMPAMRKADNKFQAAREHLADAMRLRGAERYRPRLLLQARGED